MPIEITITAYAYSELQGTAKERAREKLVEWRTDHEWWDCVYEASKEKGKELGFNIEDIRFSGFCSQGDGASWTGQVKLQTFLEHHLKENDPNYAKYTTLLMLIDDGWVENLISISRKSFMYNHSNTMQFEFAYMGYVNATEDGVIGAECPLQGANVKQLYEGIDIDGLLYDLHEWALREAKDYADEIYAQLEAAYDDAMSDQHVSVMADANEWEFDEMGRLI